MPTMTPRLMDGAMGTELRRRGLADDECAPAWNLLHPRAVIDVHRSYIAVGATVLLANTFLSDPVNLGRYGLEDRLEDINLRGVRQARVNKQCLVLGDVGPIFTPGNSREFADRGALARVILSLGEADAILFETCSSPAALEAVAFTFHRLVENQPLWLSLAYHCVEGKLVTRSGHAPETFARHAEKHGVAALGVNCGREITIDDMVEILARYRQETSLPLFARPNAGTPRREEDRWVYPRTPDEFAVGAVTLRQAGASMVGGCCGTTPEHVAALRGPRR